MRKVEKLGSELKRSQDALAESREEVRDDWCFDYKRLSLD